jgi:hypothetical protein
MRARWLLLGLGTALLAGCHPGATHGEAPTPAYGTLEPAALSVGLDADGVSTDVAISDTFQGTTYGDEGEAFVLTVQVFVDGSLTATGALQYLITAGSPGDGTFAGSTTVDLGQLAAGSHTISVQVASPSDFQGANDSAAALPIVEPIASAHG